MPKPGGPTISLPSGVKGNRNAEQVNLGNLVFPKSTRWFCDFLDKQEEVRFYWRSPVSAYIPLTLPNIVICAASTLALSNGGSISLALSGVSVIPHTSRIFQMIILATTRGEVEVEMGGPEVIRAVLVGGMRFEVVMGKDGLDTVNGLRKGLGRLFLYGEGMVDGGLLGGLAEEDVEEEEEGISQFTRLVEDEEIGDGEFRSMYRGLKWPEWLEFEDVDEEEDEEGYVPWSGEESEESNGDMYGGYY